MSKNLKPWIKGIISRKHFKFNYSNIREANGRVLLRDVSERGGTWKLRSYWEKDIYVVVSCDAELSIYKIKPEKGR